MVKKGVKKKCSSKVNYAIIIVLVLVILVSLVSIGTYFYSGGDKVERSELQVKPVQGIVTLEIKSPPSVEGVVENE